MQEMTHRRVYRKDPEYGRFSHAAFGYSGLRQIRATDLGTIRDLPGSPFQGALAFDVGDSGQVLQWVANAKSKAALFETRGQSERAHDVRTTVHQIEQAISEIIKSEVEFVLEIDPIDVRFRIAADIVSVEVLPEGLKSILSWLADLVMRLDRIPWVEERPLTEQPFVLLLDEVDVHLHPAWQRQVLPVVQGLFPNAQIFATTHSPFVVGSISSGWIYRFDLGHRGTAHLREKYEAKPGQSVDWILDEIFGVPEQFDQTTERLLGQLRDLRRIVLASHGREKMDEWRSLVERLKKIGPEVRSIVASEDRQVIRLLDEAVQQKPRSEVP